MNAKAPKTDVWYPFFVGDYRKDTARLSCEQHGAYRQLLDEYWVTGPLPDDDQILARLVGLEVRAWRKHRPHIQRYFTVADGLWNHGRVDRELAAASERAGRSRAGAAGRWGEETAAERGRNLRSQRLSEARQKGTHTADEWAALKRFCGPACLRCGQVAELVKDHIEPIYQGGSDAIDNIQPLCRSCNSGKGPEAKDHRPNGWRTALQNASEMPAGEASKRLPDACPPPSPITSQVVLFPEPSEKTETQQNGRAVQRGARLPKDWIPGVDEVVYAAKMGFHDAEMLRVAEDFRDFWTAKTGKDAVKLDWPATWRRWAREEAKRREARGPRAAKSPQKRVSFV